MSTSENLMLHGVTATCPDCADERILIEVEHGEFCCTSCDAAVVVFDAVSVMGWLPDVSRRAS